MNSAIRFSLLVPSYNRPDLIRETVLSLLDNSAPDVEILVSDDVSPKRAAVRSALSDFIEAGRIRYTQQEKNLGWSNNRNALVDAAQGDYVILLGDDDRLKPGAINSLRQWSAKRPEVSIFGLGYDVIDEHGDRVFTYCTPKPVCYELCNGDHWKEIFAYDAVPMWSHHPFTMCTKREIALAVRYKSTVDIADDVVFLYDALERGHKFMTIPEVLFDWRVAVKAGGSYATLSGSMERCHRSRGLVLADLLNRPAIREEIKALFDDTKFLARYCMFKEGDAEELQRRLKVRPVDGEDLGNFICDRAEAARLSIFRLLERQARAIKVMGFKHALNFLRYKRDKKRLARRVTRSL